MNWISLILFVLALLTFLLDTFSYATAKFKLLSLGLLFLTGGLFVQFLWQHYPLIIH